MGVDIICWRQRIGLFNGCTKSSCYIAHSMRNVLSYSGDIVMISFIGLVIEICLIISGIELNPGPPRQNSNVANDDLINCNICGQIWKAETVGMCGLSELEIRNIDFTCKSCLLEAKIEELSKFLNLLAPGLCSKFDEIHEKLDDLNNKITSLSENNSSLKATETAAIVTTTPHSSAINTKIENAEMKQGVSLKDITILGDNNTAHVSHVMSALLPNSKIVFHNIADKGYIGLCKVLEKITAGSSVIIQINKFEIPYFHRNPTDWSNSWAKVFSILQAKKAKAIFSGLIPHKYANNNWFTTASNMNSCIKKLCDKKNIPFIHPWPTLWRKDNFFNNNGSTLSSSGTAILTSLWYNQLLAAERDPTIFTSSNNTPSSLPSIIVPASNNRTSITSSVVSSNNLASTVPK